MQVLKVPGAGTITQLHVSPEKEYLAIIRSHQIYVAILPDLRHLRETELGAYKLRCFHLGPTIHCVEEAAVVSVLWHPLGEYGRCLVTVTSDAVVRLWEVNRDDRSTFEQPSTAIDLKKLANAVSADQDFSASRFGSAKGFTPDSVELEPAAVCFGGNGIEGENPWHAMTLWLATKGGDVYALCPLLPKRFETAADFIESLAALVAAKRLEAQEDRTKLLSSDAQGEFLSSLQDQEPMLAQGASEFEARYIYSKTSRPGPAPKLQGPFEIDPELDDEPEFADIYVTPFEIPEEQGFEDDQALPGSASLVCLLTSLSQVLMTIDFDGIDGQWVPARGTPFSTPKNRSLILPEEYHTLTLFEAITLPWSNDAVLTGPPSITPDVVSPHAIFVTDATGIHYISAARWIRNIQSELSDPATAETDSHLRLDVFLDSAKSLVEHPINFPKLAPSAGAITATNCVLFADAHTSRSGLGYFLLTTRAGEPWAAQLDISDSELSAIFDADIPLDDFESYSTFSVAEQRKLMLAEPRDVYRPDAVFDRPSGLPKFIQAQSRDRKSAALLREGVDIESGALLDIMIQAHKEVQAEFSDVNRAANALYSQCNRLRCNLLDQIKRARELKEVIERLTGDDDEEGDQDDGLRGGEKLERRIEDAKERQKRITERLDRLKSSLGKVSTRQLSDKEKSWAKEIEDLDRKLVTGEVDEEKGAKASGLMERVMRVTSLSAELASQAKDAAEGESGETGRKKSAAVPREFRKARVQGVMELLEREQVLVDRAVEKFGRLKVV
jgi:nucleoporin NUP82